MPINIEGRIENEEKNKIRMKIYYSRDGKKMKWKSYLWKQK